MFKWLFGSSSDQNNETSNFKDSNISGTDTTTKVPSNVINSCRAFLNGLDLFLEGSSIYLRVWVRSNVPPSQLNFYEDDKFNGLYDVDIDYVMKKPNLASERYFTDAVESVVTALTSAIKNVPTKYQKRGIEYNDYVDASIALKPAVKRFGLRQIMEQTLRNDLENHFASEIEKAWIFETKYLSELLDERKLFLKPMILKTKPKVFDEFGNVKKSRWPGDSPLEELMFDFLFKSMPDDDDLRSKFKLFAQDGCFNTHDAVPYCIKYTDNWFDDADADFSIPKDGIEFEHWCAAQLKKTGWTATVSQASGDQGSDILASKGDIVVCIQCKRYSKPVGNTAVQEVVAAKVHTGSTHSCVIATGGFTKSAKQLAATTRTVLIDAENIESFSEYF